jgi:CubicO group peptidase (beta-lactamase class C family)
LLLAAGSLFVAEHGSAGSPVADIPVELTVYAVKRSNGDLMTHIDVVVDRAADIELPAGVDSIRLIGPRGPLAIGLGDFNYSPRWRAFWYVGRGPPETGQYRVSLAGSERRGTAAADHAVTRLLPIPDHDSFVPRARETLACDQPVFSWSPVDAEGPLHYQLQIRAADRGDVYRTGYVADMRSFRLPPDVLMPGKKYEWRVRVADAPGWLSLDNRSQSKWRTVLVGPSLEPCAYRFRRPVETGDGWKTADLEDVQIDREGIERLFGEVLRGEHGKIDAVLVARNGRLVLEEYFDGYHEHARHALYSVTKSVTSLLVGIALDQGLIDSVREPVYRLFPDRGGTRWVDERYDIALENALSMSAGVEWDETVRPLDDPANDVSHLLRRSEDAVGYVLDKRQFEPPGLRWNYNSGLTVLLGAAVRNVSGLAPDTFAERYLFDPLGIETQRWLRQHDGAVHTSGGLLLRPRDMAKIGQLMLDGGRWAGRRIVSREWVEASVRAHVRYGGRGYGYQWYSGRTLVGETEVKAFWAWGYGGQFIFVAPRLELVAVFTSRPVDTVGHYMKEPGLYEPLRMLGHAILPAVVPRTPPADRATGQPDLDGVAGAYRLSNGAVVTVTRSGDDLVAVGSGNNPVRMTVATADLLRGTSDELGDFQVLARRDAEGRVTGATLYHFPFASREMVKIE